MSPRSCWERGLLVRIDWERRRLALHQARATHDLDETESSHGVFVRDPAVAASEDGGER